MSVGWMWGLLVASTLALGSGGKAANRDLDPKLVEESVTRSLTNFRRMQKRTRHLPLPSVRTQSSGQDGAPSAGFGPGRTVFASYGVTEEGRPLEVVLVRLTTQMTLT